MVAGMMGVLLLPIPRWVPGNRISRMLASAVEGWRVLKERRLAMTVGILVTVNLCVAGARLWLAFRALGQDVSPAGALFAGVLITMGQVVRLTPGNLGIREAVTGALAECVQSGFAAGVMASGLLRVLAFLLTLVLGPLSSSWLSSQLVDDIPPEAPSD